MYYAQKKSIKAGKVEFNNRTGERKEMLRQYFLYCASAATNESKNDYDFVEFGTIEYGQLKVESFNQAPEPEAEPKPEPEAENPFDT